MTRLSVVMPVYNEDRVIEDVVTSFVTEILDRLEDVEFVLVDDCSTDGTGPLLDELAARDSRLRVEHPGLNRGHGPSLRRAIDASSGQWIFHADSDGQFLARDFWDLWKRRSDADLILGVRAERHDPLHRLVLTRMVRVAVGVLAGRRIADANVPFKLFRRELWDELSAVMPPTTLAPSVLLSAGSCVLGKEIVEVPVTHIARPHGESTLRLGRLLRFSIRGLGQLLRFRLRLFRLASGQDVAARPSTSPD